MVCPTCGREVRPNRWRTAPATHYNPHNPPVYGAWANCPGPSEEEKRRAVRDFPDRADPRPFRVAGCWKWDTAR